MEGYVRSEEVRVQLMAALALALHRHPEQRLGQLLYNLAREDARIWTMWDEEWITMLNGC